MTAAPEDPNQPLGKGAQSAYDLAAEWEAALVTLLEAPPKDETLTSSEPGGRIWQDWPAFKDAD